MKLSILCLLLLFCNACVISGDLVKKRSPSSAEGSNLVPDTVIKFTEDLLVSNSHEFLQYELISLHSITSDQPKNKFYNKSKCELVFFMPPNTELFIPKGTLANIVQDSTPDLGLFGNKNKYLGNHGKYTEKQIYFKGKKDPAYFNGPAISFKGAFSCYYVVTDAWGEDSKDVIGSKAGYISKKGVEQMMLAPSNKLPVKISEQ